MEVARADRACGVEMARVRDHVFAGVEAARAPVDC